MYKVIIIEDNPLELDIITSLVKKEEKLSIDQVFETFTDAIPHLWESDVDLALVDINLPEGDFFSLVEGAGKSSEELPYTIFVTAHDRYALSAFNIGAVDYILKPVQEGRFAQAIKRFLSTRHRVVAYLNFIHGPHTIRVPYEDIQYITADGKHSILHTTEADLTCPRSLGELETDLPESMFLRCHRKYMVNTTIATQVHHQGKGCYSIQLSTADDTLLPVGRNYLKEVNRLFNK